MALPRFRGVLLCEDREHERFFRRLLERWIGKGKLHVNRIPNRGGAGDAYVVAEYAKEVQQARRWKSENYALVVAIDGDREKLHGRLERLDRRLETAGLPRRTENESIIICVPSRNIETWEIWLCGVRDIDEKQDYQQRFREAERQDKASPKMAVREWFRSLSAAGSRLEEKTLPALSAARAEVRRFES